MSQPLRAGDAQAPIDDGPPIDEEAPDDDDNDPVDVNIDHDGHDQQDNVPSRQHLEEARLRLEGHDLCSRIIQNATSRI